MEAIRETMKSGAIFEINSGAIARGIKNRIYPAMFMLKEICRLGGKVVLSSDAHRAEQLVCISANGMFIERGRVSYFDVFNRAWMAGVCFAWVLKLQKLQLVSALVP